MSGPIHTPVLLREVVEFLVTDSSGFYVDATFGRGGHAAAVLERLDPRAALLGIDRDPAAVGYGRERFATDARVRIEHARFDRLEALVEERGKTGGVAGVLFDLGVSSPQLDEAERGFSFLNDGPLDMRMDPTTGISAAQWIARAPAADIEHVLREYGEERFARRIAAAIVRERAEQSISTTARLADIVARANPAWEKGKNPATRSFQAIRIHINDELQVLREALLQCVRVLRPGGRMVVISFHSLEDRIVKRFIRDRARPEHVPGSLRDRPPQLRRIGRSVQASDSERHANPRARSAVLRVAEKLAVDGGVHG